MGIRGGDGGAHRDECVDGVVMRSTFINSMCVSLDPKIPDFSEVEIKNEPMLFNCDLEHAWELGGPITREVLSHLPYPWQDVPLVIDSRVHMLMPGWTPCVPGWHHDDVPRTREDGQPNYGPGQYRSQHLVCLVNGDICPTAIAIGAGHFDIPPVGEIIYREWHKEVERRLLDKRLDLFTVQSNRLYQIDDRTWHTGTKAIANGWRFFIRISRYFDPEGRPIARANPRTNELRRNAQVYLEFPMDGW